LRAYRRSAQSMTTRDELVDQLDEEAVGEALAYLPQEE
jgi:hypothetical protein